MKKIILAITLFFLLFSSATFTATLSYAQITSTTDPAPIYQNLPDGITITFSSKEEFFNKDQMHTLGIWSPDGAKDHYFIHGAGIKEGFSGVFSKPGSLTPSTFETGIIPKDNQSFHAVFIKIPRDKIKEQGVWKYKLWKGGHNGLKDDETLIHGSTFVVTPPNQFKNNDFSNGIGIAKIKLYSPVKVNADMKVVLDNVYIDEEYELSFAGSLRSLYKGTLDQQFHSIKSDTDGGYIVDVFITPTETGLNKAICLSMTKLKSGLRCNYLSQSFDVLANVSGTEEELKSTDLVGIPEGQLCDEESTCPADTACQFKFGPTKIDPGNFVCTRSLSVFTGEDLPFSAVVCAEGEDKNGKLITREQIEEEQARGEYTLTNSITKCLSINTAIGPISTKPAEFVRRLFSLVLGLAGGIALVLIMISGYKFMISQGNPEKMADAREHLTSAVVGLLFIIFSFVILQVIGVDILRIPGFQP